MHVRVPTYRCILLFHVFRIPRGMLHTCLSLPHMPGFQTYGIQLKQSMVHFLATIRGTGATRADKNVYKDNLYGSLRTGSKYIGCRKKRNMYKQIATFPVKFTRSAVGNPPPPRPREKKLKKFSPLRIPLVVTSLRSGVSRPTATRSPTSPRPRFLHGIPHFACSVCCW